RGGPLSRSARSWCRDACGPVPVAVLAPGGGSAPRPHEPVFFPGWSVLPGRSAPDPGDLASPTAFLLQPADEAPACGWLAEPRRARGVPWCRAALGPLLSPLSALTGRWPEAAPV